MSKKDMLGSIMRALVGVDVREHGLILDIINKLGSSEAFEVHKRLTTALREAVVSTAASLRPFAKWRTFTIGGVSKGTLLERVASFVSDWARDLMKRPAFTTKDTEEVIDTIILTPKDFGYERMPTTAELLDPARLVEWSKQNAERLDGYVVELLPAEAGPHIRLQYQDQPNGEILWIAMERIVDSDGFPLVFTVKRRDDGKLWLFTDWALPGDEWYLDDRVVFRLRKVTQD